MAVPKPPLPPRGDSDGGRGGGGIEGGGDAAEDTKAEAKAGGDAKGGGGGGGIGGGGDAAEDDGRRVEVKEMLTKTMKADRFTIEYIKSLKSLNTDYTNWEKMHKNNETEKFDLINLKLIDSKYIKELGIPAKHLINTKSVTENYTVPDLSVTDLYNANYNATELILAGQDYKDLRKVGYTKQDIKNALAAKRLKEGGDMPKKDYDIINLYNIGFTASDVKNIHPTKYTPNHLFALGYSARDINYAEYPTSLNAFMNKKLYAAYSSFLNNNRGYVNLLEDIILKISRKYINRARNIVVKNTTTTTDNSIIELNPIKTQIYNNMINCMFITQHIIPPLANILKNFDNDHGDTFAATKAAYNADIHAKYADTIIQKYTISNGKNGKLSGTDKNTIMIRVLKAAAHTAVAAIASVAIFYPLGGKYQTDAERSANLDGKDKLYDEFDKIFTIFSENKQRKGLDNILTDFILNNISTIGNEVDKIDTYSINETEITETEINETMKIVNNVADIAIFVTTNYNKNNNESSNTDIGKNALSAATTAKTVAKPVKNKSFFNVSDYKRFSEVASVASEAAKKAKDAAIQSSENRPIEFSTIMAIGHEWWKENKEIDIRIDMENREKTKKLDTYTHYGTLQNKIRELYKDNRTSFFNKLRRDTYIYLNRYDKDIHDDIENSLVYAFIIINLGNITIKSDNTNDKINGCINNTNAICVNLQSIEDLLTVAYDKYNTEMRKITNSNTVDYIYNYFHNLKVNQNAQNFLDDIQTPRLAGKNIIDKAFSSVNIISTGKINNNKDKILFEDEGMKEAMRATKVATDKFHGWNQILNNAKPDVDGYDLVLNAKTLALESKNAANSWLNLEKDVKRETYNLENNKDAQKNTEAKNAMVANAKEAETNAEEAQTKADEAAEAAEKAVEEVDVVDNLEGANKVLKTAEAQVIGNKWMERHIYARTVEDAVEKAADAETKGKYPEEPHNDDNKNGAAKQCTWADGDSWQVLNGAAKFLNLPDRGAIDVLKERLCSAEIHNRVVINALHQAAAAVNKANEEAEEAEKEMDVEDKTEEAAAAAKNELDEKTNNKKILVQIFQHLQNLARIRGIGVGKGRGEGRDVELIASNANDDMDMAGGGRHTSNVPYTKQVRNIKSHIEKNVPNKTIKKSRMNRNKVKKSSQKKK